MAQCYSACAAPWPRLHSLPAAAPVAPPAQSTVHSLILFAFVSAQALIDSSSVGNFISHQLLWELQVQRNHGHQALRFQTILGKPLGRGNIKHFSPTLTLRISCLHTKYISFMVLEGSTADILGCPWMVEHTQLVDWNMGEVLKWGEKCFQSCLSPMTKVSSSSSSVSSEPSSSSLELNSTSVVSPEVSCQIQILPEYLAFQDVFSKRLATHLPPHWPWDCAIDLYYVGPEEGGCHLELAHSWLHQGPSKVPQCCQLLPPTHQKLQSNQSNQHQSLSWIPSATLAFERLKKALSSAPVLCYPVPDLPFVVEVDVSITGVGAVLS